MITSLISLAFVLLIVWGVICLISDPAGTMYFVGSLIGMFVKAILDAVKGVV